MRRRVPSKLGWLSEGVIITTRLGTPETTAIVHPALFTRAVMQAAREHGAQLRSGAVTAIVRRGGEPTVWGVEVGGAVIEADAVVIALGPWSLLAAEWLPLPAVIGQLSPSLVFNTGADVPAESLFLEYQEETGVVLTVEVFPRADGSTLVTAFSDEVPLPIEPTNVTPDQGKIERLEVICERLSPAFARSSDCHPAGLLPSGHAGGHAADRKCAAERRRLCRHWPQCLGDTQCTRDRRGFGGADRRWRRDQHRSHAVRPHTAAPARSRTSAP